MRMNKTVKEITGDEKFTTLEEYAYTYKRLYIANRMLKTSRRSNWWTDWNKTLDEKMHSLIETNGQDLVKTKEDSDLWECLVRGSNTLCYDCGCDIHDRIETLVGICSDCALLRTIGSLN